VVEDPMIQNDSLHDIAKRRIVYTTPAMDRVCVERDVSYSDEVGTLTMDLYRPPDDEAAARAAVLLVTGYPDAGFARMLGCPIKQIGAFVSWAQLLASAGLIAITYTNREPGDAQILFDYVLRHAARLGIDAGRIALWSCSGHGPNALALLMNNAARVRCACLMSAYTLDGGGHRHVAEAAERFHFANGGRSIEHLPPDVPVFVARGGRDEMPGLNAALDAFVYAALDRNLPITLINHSTGPHAFDVFDDGEASQEVIRSVVRFLQCHLRRAEVAERPSSV
jgi:hypothetical protein